MRAIGILAVFLLGACSSVPSFEPQSVFESKEHEPFLEKGTGSISGQAFLRDRHGDVKLAAGNEVLLVPATSFSREWYEEIVIAGKEPRPQSHFKPIRPYVRSMRADADGRFRFEQLPGGEYYLYCLITWQVPSVYGGYQPGWFYCNPYGFGPYGFGPGGFGFAHGGRRFRGGWPYPYVLPFAGPVYHTSSTAGGVAHAVVALRGGETRTGVVVTRGVRRQRQL